MESGRHGDIARKTGAIGAALRGSQVVGEHTLISPRHRAYRVDARAFDRRAFANGAVRAALGCRAQAGLSMMDVLGMGE